ncbi:MAG: KEOPS complex subunit Cgi121 [Candidatus Helarchaeota archaeon]
MTDEKSKFKLIGITAIRAQNLLNINIVIDEIKKLSMKYDCEVQLLNANKIATWEHLFFAAINALRSFQGGYNLAKSLSMELMLHVAANRQIKVAIETFGIKIDNKEIAVVIFANKEENIHNITEELIRFFNGVEDLDLLNIDQNKLEILKKIFNINDGELTNLINIGPDEDEYKTIIKIIIDRGALVNLEK